MTAARTRTNRLMVKEVPLGAGSPLPLQSMLTTSTQDVCACLEQVHRLQEVGCHIVRLAIESSKDLDGFEAVCKESPLPVVADIHFNHTLAIEAAKRGAAKLRINPGNIGDAQRVNAVIEAANKADIPIRIGVNAGSLEEDLKKAHNLTLAEKMVKSAERSVEHFEERGFFSIVLSAKASDVPTTIEVYQRLSMSLPHIPLHLGVTEAGTAWEGSIRSAVGIGTLLAVGIGDTLRVSLTADPIEEIRVARALLAALDLGADDRATLISCPSCSRCKVDLFSIANTVEQRLAAIKKPLKVAVMGCVVNGPGEAAGADIGVACGKGTGVIFSKGKVLYTVEEAQIIDALLKELEIEETTCH